MNKKMLIGLVFLAALGLGLWLLWVPATEDGAPEEALPPGSSEIEIQAPPPEGAPADDEQNERMDPPPPPAAGAPKMEEPAIALSESEIAETRSAMKISLAAVYGAQQSFYSEYKRYSTDFRALGFYPEKSMPAKFGFLSPYSPEKLVGNEDPRFLDSDALAQDPNYAPEKRVQYRGLASSLSLGDYAHFCRQGCTASEDKFEMLAVAQFTEGKPPEVWTINEKKELRQLQDGTGKPAKGAF